jgi:pimeloyl-ACP methyl ester carboxylesterase
MSNETNRADAEPIARTYRSQGLRLRYYDWGNPDAPCLLLVHGIQDHARGWDWTARALRCNWHVIAPDLRGHGDSDWSGDGAYLSSYYILDIANLVAELGCESLAVVAHSLGGNIMARFTAAFPQRVQKLALIEGLGPSLEALTSWSQRGPVRRMRDWIETQQAALSKAPHVLATFEDAVARIRKMNPRLSAEQAGHLARHGIRQHADGYRWKNDPLVPSFAPEDFSADNTAFWREIGCPTLLLYGADSWTTNPETDGRARHFAAHRTLVIDRAGHWLHHDQFDLTIAALREFLDDAR